MAAAQELARYWTSEYDWRTCEARLNALPQFKTTIDGLDIHFIHVKSAHEHALPLVMTHGWPGSVVELLETIGPLTDPTAHGGSAEDAFHLVLPSIPGYGFSDEPTELGWGPIRIGQAWDELMRRLGYSRYVAQGGDVGSQVTDAMGRIGLDGLIAIHTNLLTPALGDPEALSASPPTEEERAALDQLDAFHATGTGYFVEQATRPETIGYGLLDSPIALATWMIDHDTDAYLKIARAFVDKQPSGNLTREHIVDNITLYWLTGTGAVGGALVLGGRSGERSGGGRGARGGLDPGRLHLVPRGDLADAAQLGRDGHTPTSCTTTRSTRAGTSRRGKSRNSSPRRCAPASGHCARPRERFVTSEQNGVDPLDRPSPRGRGGRATRRGSSGVVRRRDRVAQLRSAHAGESSRARRPRRLLDLHVCELAAHASVRSGLGRQVPRRRPDRHRLATCPTTSRGR